MKNTSAFKNIALVVLGIFSLFAILRFTGMITSPTVPNSNIQQESIIEPITFFQPMCDTCKNRYHPPEVNSGMMIPTSQFTTATSFYQDIRNPIDIRTCYVFITKRAIDHMLNYNCNVNGLNCYFGLKSTTPGGNKLTLMFTPASSSRTAFDKTTYPGSIVFESNTLCPDVCGTNDTTGVCH